MGIWRALTGTVHCDNCEKFIAHIQFDAADEPNIERVRVTCSDCYQPNSEGDNNGS